MDGPEKVIIASAQPNFLPAIILGLIMFVVGLISGFVFTKYQEYQSFTSQTPAPTTTTVVTETLKTYTNDAGFSISYPSSLKTQIVSADLNEREANSSDKYFFIFDPSSTNPYTQRIIDFEVTQVQPTTTADAQVFPLANGTFVRISMSKDPTQAALAQKILATFKTTAQVPAAGICSGVSADQVVTITIGQDNVPSPRCQNATKNQMLKIINNSTTAISLNLPGLSISVKPGNSYQFTSNLGSFLTPGVNNLAGAEIWLQ